MTPREKTILIKALGAAIGFDRVGVTTAEPLQRAAHYRRWLGAGHAGSMAYLHRNVELRCQPAQILPGARSIVCVALNYKRSPEESVAAGAGVAAGEKGEKLGRVSSHARGVDYHVVVRGKLEWLIEEMRRRVDECFEARAFVDSGPLIERELAARAGLGWIGKNTMLMHERAGSYLFLGEIVSTLELEADAPATDHCGTCTRCLDACPTAAFPAAYELDASRCISYLTIEHRGEIAAEFRGKIGDWVYGCDICQEVCPFNVKSPLGTDAELMRDLIKSRTPLVPLTRLTSGDYKRLTKGTATRRATREMWRRNAAIALSNVNSKSTPL